MRSIQGELRTDVHDLRRTRGSVAADLTSLVVHRPADGGDAESD
ncbi:hypothetical protein ACFL5O_11930 [Myxococcota bacterium]